MANFIVTLPVFVTIKQNSDGNFKFRTQVDHSKPNSLYNRLLPDGGVTI